MKRLAKYLTALTIILNIALSAFAAVSGSSDHVLLFYPRNVTSDPEYAINLLDSNNYELKTIGDDPINFSPTSTNNLAIFRLYDTLPNDYSTIKDRGDRTPYSPGNNSMFTNGNSATILIHTSGLFVKTDDPGVTRDFSLSCILNEASIKTDGSGYEVLSGYKNIVLNPGEKKLLSANNSQMYTQFDDLGGGDYKLFCPSSPTVSVSDGYDKAYFPLYLRLFDICVKLEPPKSGERVEPGYYSTTITIESEQPYTNIIWTGTTSQGGSHIDHEDMTIKMVQTFTVYGYVEGEGFLPAVHQMVISPASDSYSMNLANTSSVYCVAKIDFHADDTLDSDNDSSIIPNNSTRKKARENMYKVYVTPNMAYVPGQTDYGVYEFSRVLNPSEKISYELYMKTSSGDTKATAITSSTQFPDNMTIGHAESISDSLLCITPHYMVYTEKYSNNSNKVKYSEFWNLSDVYIYLKVTDTAQHTVGQYTSNIYFTLVSST